MHSRMHMHPVLETYIPQCNAKYSPGDVAMPVPRFVFTGRPVMFQPC